AWFSIWLYRAPPVVPASAPAGEFSGERAFRHVEVIARRPHPRGSPANATVRDYLLGELRALGWEPAVQRVTTTGAGRGPRGALLVIATSAFAFGYHRMPNNSDFTRFLEGGFNGMNFAFIDGAEHYHRPTDTPANLSLNSVQHVGDYALPLARHFGNATLPR